MYIMRAARAETYMANPRTFDLLLLAQSSGVDLTEYPVACYYCGKWLTAHEKILYHHSGLLLVWKDDVPYACCQPCIKTGAKVDFLVGFARTVHVGNLLEVSSLPWSEVLCRCLMCLRILNPAEKEDIQRHNRAIYVVKDKLRSPCALCRLGL